TLKAADVQYSSQLPTTKAWTYEGTVPGPTIVVRRGQKVHVHWSNQIDPSVPLPYQVFQADDPATADDPFPQNFPGTGGQSGDVALTASIVTHLHGGRTSPDSDGWTENVTPFGGAQHTYYENDQRPTLLWYHDHAMGITRLNVFAGLFGLWLIRGQPEQGLINKGILPHGKDEVCLVIQDRNLDLDKNDPTKFSGAILHKSEKSTAEMFGPYTMVNGVIWPCLEVGAGRVRLRLLNGSNARTYCLRLVEVTAINDKDGTVTYGQDYTDNPGVIWQVGSDGGLFGHPVPPTSNATTPDNQCSPAPPAKVNRGLILAPAERADLVIDFSQIKGKVAFVNTAFAPFHGSTVTFPFLFDPSGVLKQEMDRNNKPVCPQAPGSRIQEFRLTYAEVLLFNVQAPTDKLPGTTDPASILTQNTPLDETFTRYVLQAPTGNSPPFLVIPPDPDTHQVTQRWIVLTEEPPGHLYFRELEPVTPQSGVVSGIPLDLPIIAINDAGNNLTFYQTAAMGFHDRIRIMVPYQDYEVWNFINLTVDSHPVHVHLVQFQVLSRTSVDTSVYATERGYTAPNQPIDLTDPNQKTKPRDLDLNEQGFKDTVRINPGEVVSVAAQYEGFCGRFMYHCHILEHEDMDMMRPFIVFPRDALAAMQAGMNGMAGMSSMAGMGMGTMNGMTGMSSMLGRPRPKRRRRR
ncbi:MAG: multicopper oxidase domain-containing protein, partial [Planctomycetes bacterium]|nr:multicopper oxidase domain-containing protein [Planctomycetota bacterium]